MAEYDPRDMPKEVVQDMLENAHIELKRCNSTRCYHALNTKEGKAAADFHCSPQILGGIKRTIQETQEILESGGIRKAKKRTSSRKRKSRRHKRKKSNRRTSRKKKPSRKKRK